MRRTFFAAAIAAIALLGSFSLSMAADPVTSYRTVSVGDAKVFYREAGDPKKPALLLLHGFPTSSHMFRNLIPLLADRYHVIAPDYPSFGFSDMPDRVQFKYTFEHFTEVMDGFTQAVGLKRYAMYIFDYGAPIGMRLALAHPERVTAIISQNGNVYEEGLSAGFAGRLKASREPTEQARAAWRAALTPEAGLRRYMTGVPETQRALVAPETYTLDNTVLARPGNDEIQLDLLMDYNSNLALYPKFQEYLRVAKPPVLAVWGKNDQTFVSAGAEAFRRDVPDAEVHLYDTGHFALETHLHEIAGVIRDFLRRKVEHVAATSGGISRPGGTRSSARSQVHSGPATDAMSRQ
jgi:pimeloyl-ACP methyl ester carboxylesterase